MTFVTRMVLECFVTVEQTMKYVANKFAKASTAAKLGDKSSSDDSGSDSSDSDGSDDSSSSDDSSKKKKKKKKKNKKKNMNVFFLYT